MSINGLNSARWHGTGQVTDQVTDKATVMPGPALKPIDIPSVVPQPVAPPIDSGDLSEVVLYSRPAVRAEVETQRIMDVMELYSRGVAKASATLRHSYEDAVKALSPGLLAKDWGFSVQNEQLVILQGKDALSADERATLRKTLSGVESAANGVADTMIRAIDLDRVDGYSKYIGRFDVSQANFGDIVDLRSYLFSHGPDGYGRDVKDQSNYESLYFLTGGMALMDQIVERAEARFLTPAKTRSDVHDPRLVARLEG
jgi:hypothetical protein